jgi:hypothetical protein
VIRFPLQHRIRNQLRTSFVRDVVLRYRHLGLLPEDVMLASYPKSGTTWLSFMLAELLWQAGREQTLVDNRYLPQIGKHNVAIRRLPSGGRLIRTHERRRPCYRKAIYVLRDGRDVAVSMYWQIKRTCSMDADFSDYLDAYFDGHLTGAGAWHEHVSGWLEPSAVNSGNTLVVRYEDMKDDAARELRRAAAFLGVERTTEEFDRAIQAGSLEAMKGREKESPGIAHRESGATIPVVRKGVVGDWTNYFSEADLQRFWDVCGPAMCQAGYSVDIQHDVTR